MKINKPSSPFGWVYLAVLIAHVAGFYIGYLNHDSSEMIWCAVIGSGWGKMARDSWAKPVES